MLYEWSNAQRLHTLRAWGEEDELRFQSKSESVTVKLNSDGFISHVLLYDGVEERKITDQDTKKVIVGDGICEREVIHFLAPGGPSKRLRLGITHHKVAGGWSSLPHDFELNTEPGFEEVFFHVLKGGTQRAAQFGRGVWCDGSEVDAVWPVSDRTFSTIPMGYHPVVGEPDVKVSYIWIYDCKYPRWEKI